MKENLESRIEQALAQTRAVLDQFQDIENRVGEVVEGQRQQLGMVIGDLRVRENQHLLHQLIAVLNGLKKEVSAS